MEPTVPPAMGLLLMAAGLAVLRYGHLRWRDRRRAPARERLRHELADSVARLARDEARDGRLPDDQGVAPTGWRYRPLPSLRTDKRLLVLHEDAPRQRLPVFPREVPARTVVFADGRVQIFADDAFERLLHGDNVLRERLGLGALDADGEEQE